MIVDILIAVVASFIWVIATLFSAFNVAVPAQFTDAVEYFLSKLSYISGIVNVPDILTALGWFLTLTTLFYTIKLILWVIHFIPGVPHKSPKL